MRPRRPATTSTSGRESLRRASVTYVLAPLRRKAETPSRWLGAPLVSRRGLFRGCHGVGAATGVRRRGKGRAAGLGTRAGPPGLRFGGGRGLTLPRFGQQNDATEATYRLLAPARWRAGRPRNPLLNWPNAVIKVVKITHTPSVVQGRTLLCVPRAHGCGMILLSEVPWGLLNTDQICGGFLLRS